MPISPEPSLFPPEEMGGVSLEEVIEAYYDCRRNKRNTVNQLRFEMDYERECIELWLEINEHRYEPRRSIAFVVDKPVKREIFAADFRDRVVHHLIVRRVMPLLEAKFHPESYSTQKGKGTLYGIQRIEEQLKACSEDYTRDCYIMKIDISGFFMSLSKQALYDCIHRFLMPRYPAHGLTLHPRKTYVQHYAKGVLFIGGMILPGRKYMSRRTVGFMHMAIESCRRLVGENPNPPMEFRDQVRTTVNSYFGMLQHYDALRLTGSVIRNLPQKWYRWMYIVRRGHRCKMVVRGSIP